MYFRRYKRRVATIAGTSFHPCRDISVTRRDFHSSVSMEHDVHASTIDVLHKSCALKRCHRLFLNYSYAD